MIQARVRSYNQQVLRNEGNDYCTWTHLLSLIGLELTTGRSTQCAPPPFRNLRKDNNSFFWYRNIVYLEL